MIVYEVIFDREGFSRVSNRIPVRIPDFFELEHVLSSNTLKTFFRFYYIGRVTGAHLQLNSRNRMKFFFSNSTAV